MEYSLSQNLNKEEYEIKYQLVSIIKINKKL